MATHSRQQRHERHEKQEKSGGILKRAGGALTSLAGIATAIAAITTSAAAVFGVEAHDKATQLQQLQVTVNSQAQRIQVQAAKVKHLQQAAATVTASPAATPTASPATTPSDSGGAQITDASHFLSNKQPTVDNANWGNGQVVMSAKSYANSITFYCDGVMNNGAPDEAFDVAGSSTFTAVVGIPDDTPDVTGFIATITFSNESGQQIGKPIQVSLGHPVNVSLGIGGVTQLGMTCDGRNRQNNSSVSDFRVGFGDAGVS